MSATGGGAGCTIYHATAQTTVWLLVFGDGTNFLGLDLESGAFALTYATAERHTSSGDRARVDEGFLTISARCHEDIRDQIRAVGAIDESIAVELIDSTSPILRDRVVRRFTLLPQ